MTRLLPFSIMLCLAAAVPAQYCADATHVFPDCGFDEFISNTAIDTLNNPNACVGAPAYQDFTFVAGPTLLPGNTYPIAVTISQCWEGDEVRVWIDWDGNASFADAGEETILTPVVSTIGCFGDCTIDFVGSILVPAAPVASTRMRVRVNFDGPPAACGVQDYGETEDYTVSTVAADFVATPNAPGAVAPGAIAHFTLTMTSVSPPNPPVVTSATVDLSAIGGSAAAQLFDDGISGGDAAAGDNVFTLDYLVPPATSFGPYVLPFTAVDSIARVSTGAFVMSVSPGNDTCATATLVGTGVNGPYSNFGATDDGLSISCGWAGSPGYKDVWFVFVPTCTAMHQIDTDSPPYFDTNMGIYDACGGNEIACSEDDGVNGPLTSLVTINLTAGVPVWIRVGSWDSVATGTFNLNISAGVPGVTWSSPLGAGSIQWDISGGPANGTYFHAIDFFPGNFPNGWFFGIDIPLQEVVNQVLAGFPFVGPLDACGANTLGPFGGLPSGFTLYSVAILMTGPGLSGATAVTPPTSHTIP